MNRIINYYTSFKRIIKSTLQDVENIKRISDDRYRRLLLTGGSSALVKLFSGLINLMTIPLTVNYLGSERYGLWMGISSILALMSFADLGLGNGLVNAISKANGRKSNDDAKIAVSSTFFILLFISIILFLLFISFFPFI